jgi:hypothetical protein
MMPIVGKRCHGRNQEKVAARDISLTGKESIRETPHGRRRLSIPFRPAPDLHRGGEVE